MKRVLCLVLSALLLTPGESFAQAVSAVRTAPSPASKLALQIPAQAQALVPLIPLQTALVAAPLLVAKGAGIPTAADALRTRAAELAVPGSDAAPVLDALFDNGEPLSAAAIMYGGPGPAGEGPRLGRGVPTTPSEILLVGILGLGLGIGLGHHHESNREKHIPLGFSEVSQIERDIASAGLTVGPLTRYLTSTNDLTMKVFESWNESHAKTLTGSNVRRFAIELENRMDPALKLHHYEIYDFLRDLPFQADAALAKLEHLTLLRRGLRPVVADFNHAWDESHYDHYRTEYYTETVTDSNGMRRTETRSRQVYDHTTHTYTYRRQFGERASSGADALIAGTGSLSVDEKLRTSSRTNVEGEDAARKRAATSACQRPIL